MKNLCRGTMYLLLLALGCLPLIAGDENSKEFKAWRERFYRVLARPAGAPGDSLW